MGIPVDDFIKTIARLRAPDGCPWDREQDHKSLARYLLEESYEVLEAIHQNDPDKLKEELGDLLLQIALHAQIASESNQYNFDDIAAVINAKMITRHPHVFGDAQVSSASEVVSQWEAIKAKEAEAKGQKNGSALDGITTTLPALLKSLKISEKAVGQGFEWQNFDELWDKVLSELAELKEALALPESDQRQSEVEMELGDLLFTLVNVARWNSLNPEESLLRAVDKFKLRYRTMEEISAAPLNELSKNELAELWNQAKIKTQKDL
ncbi:MAG: nucleoside triphosphate pyrophosphohydrolase [Candidatus Obscuribacterales bacterium]|nr:nucleoside triphosphate pyrophosphohydrolase [Candidatus Obscuribacterales bacterium]